jgi:tetratricopeptide (TPR) repeat protein
MDYRRAEALLDDLHRPELAEEELRRLLSANPEDGYALTLLARARGEQRKLKEAESVVMEAMRLCPDKSFPYRVHGWLLAKQHLFSSAEKAFCEALRLEPDNCDLYAAYANVLLRLNKFSAALTAADRGLAIHAGHVGCLNCRAQALICLEEFSDAEIVLNEALRQDPNEYRSHVTLGFLYEKRDQPFKALRSYRTALELDPQNNWTAEQVRKLLLDKADFVMGLIRGIIICISTLSIIPIGLVLLNGFKQNTIAGLGYIMLAFAGAWISFGIRYQALRLAVLMMTPSGRLIATTEQFRRSFALVSTVVFLKIAAMGCSWWGLLYPWVGFIVVAVIHVLGIPLLLILPSPDRLSLRLGLTYALVPACIAVVNLFCIALQWYGRWLVLFGLAYALALLIVYMVLQTQKEAKGQS